MPIWLTSHEIAEITAKKRPAAQIRALAQIGIDYKVRPDGTPLVSRLAFERALGGIDRRAGVAHEPDFGAILGA